MEKQEIEIAILPDGRLEYTIRGIKGTACSTVSALLERLGRIEQSERTAEYYEDRSTVGVDVDIR